MDAWLDIWRHSNTLCGGQSPRVELVAWPNGLTFLDQEVIVVEIFDLLSIEWLNDQMRKLQRARRK